MSSREVGHPFRIVAVAALAALAGFVPGEAQEPVRGASDARLDDLAQLQLPELDFDPPRPDSGLIRGVPTFVLTDRSLPLVRIYARIRGGYAYLPRSDYGLATALPLILRSSGTAEIPPDSVDALVEALALETTFGTDGTATTSTLDALTTALEPGLELWSRLLTRPRFDAEALETWRLREVSSVRRFPEDPGRLAISRFNRLMYGDHSIGWEMTEADLSPDRVNPETLQELHARTFCRDHLVLGAAGDIDMEQARELLDPLVEAFAPCPETLPRPPAPTVRTTPGVFVIPKASEQSVLILAHTTEVERADGAPYFAAQVANSVLGGGGFSSRLLARVRTEEGLAYGASSFWTTPGRYPGILGVTTRTGAERTLEALEVLRAVMTEVRSEPPSEREVTTSVDRLSSGFVFNFETAGQVVARQMAYREQGLPADWLTTYLAGIQAVDRDGVARVLEDEVRPDDFVILIVGDPERFADPDDVLRNAVFWPEDQLVPPGGDPGS